MSRERLLLAGFAARRAEGRAGGGGGSQDAHVGGVFGAHKAGQRYRGLSGCTNEEANA